MRASTYVSILFQTTVRRGQGVRTKADGVELSADEGKGGSDGGGRREGGGGGGGRRGGGEERSSRILVDMMRHRGRSTDLQKAFAHRFSFGIF